MNKKIVVLIVLLECIFAVFLVSFFGKAIEDARATILCKDIYFTNESGEKIEDGVMLEYTLTESNICYQLHWTLVADDTTKKEVEFISTDPSVIVNKQGLVTFIEETDVRITIRATDGSGKTDTITLVPKRGGGDIEIK